MDKLGEYEYPSIGSFEEALAIADQALNKFGGVIPNAAAARIVGYNVSDDANLGGPIYKRFNELSSFGLFVKDRGGLRATDLAKDALDPFDQSKANNAKAKAIRNITIIGKAYDDWNGNIPDSNAFPAKLAALTQADWTECRKHAAKLEKLFKETFSYLAKAGQVTPTLITPQKSTNDSGSGLLLPERREMVTERGQPILGELRTKVGTVVIINKSTVKVARALLDAIEDEMNTTKENAVEEDSKAEEG